jgi:hypothetical protein
MKGRVVILAVVAFLLLTTSGLAQAGRWYPVEKGTAAGGGYRLTSLAPAQGDTWQVQGSASGGGYRLLAPVTAGYVGSGCCCTYLPCVLRSH